VAPYLVCVQDRSEVKDTAHSNVVSVFISTGEVSGDLQGALLIEALKRQAVGSGLKWSCGGGAHGDAGATLLGNTISIGSIGPLESLPLSCQPSKSSVVLKQYLHQHPPDLVLIDYAGPNLEHRQLHQTADATSACSVLYCPDVGLVVQCAISRGL